jgi:hypothetical protein
MKRFLKHQSTLILILLAGLFIIAVGSYSGGYRLKASNYLPLIKFSPVYNDQDTNILVLTNFNFGFEEVSGVNRFPVGWQRWGYGSYTMEIDSVVKHSGKYALRVEPRDEPAENEFGAP